MTSRPVLRRTSVRPGRRAQLRTIRIGPRWHHMSQARGLDGGRAAAIVIGLDSVTGLQSARLLAGHGIPVIGIASDPEHFCARTRAVRAVVQARTSTAALIDALCALGPTLSTRAVLYPCTDASVLLIARERSQLARWYHVVLPETGLLTSLMDKVQFLEVATRCGLPVPATRVLRERADAEAAARELPFPCVVKPGLKTTRWEANAPYKVLRVESGAELLDVYDRYARFADMLIAQQWIEGADDTLYSCNCYYGRQRQPLCSFIARKVRQWPPRTGISCLSVEERNDTVRDMTLRLFGQLGYRGLGYLEVKRDPTTGAHYAIEANPGRPTGRSAIAEAGGVELLYSMYCETLGLPLPVAREQRYTGTKWINWRQDVRSGFYYWRRGELTLREWISSCRGVTVDAVFSWSDPAPFLADLGGIALNVLRGRWTKRRRRAARPTPHLEMPS